MWIGIDPGGLRAEHEFEVLVVDKNDNPKIQDRADYVIPEDTPTTYEFAGIDVTDDDEGDDIIFYLQGGGSNKFSVKKVQTTPTISTAVISPR